VLNVTSGGITYGAGPAVSGAFRTANNILSLSARNALGTTDIWVVYVDGSDVINLGHASGANAGINITTPNALTLTAGLTQINGGGVVVGAATGGSEGVGTINVAVDIFKNGSAYTNPDYVFEKAFTGEIVKFADHAGASNYDERVTLDMDLARLEEHCREMLRLPGIDDEPMGMFERGDFILEKIEEIFLHLFNLRRRVDQLAAA
jgi:hypothetical protein